MCLKLLLSTYFKVTIKESLKAIRKLLVFILNGKNYEFKEGVFKRTIGWYEYSFNNLHL